MNPHASNYPTVEFLMKQTSLIVEGETLSLHASDLMAYDQPSTSRQLSPSPNNDSLPNKPPTPLLCLPMSNSPLNPKNQPSIREKLLISSIPLQSSLTSQGGCEGHQALVESVVEALNPHNDLLMEEAHCASPEGSNDGDYTMEPDDDMVLSKFQKDVKLEALARRGPS